MKPPSSDNTDPKSPRARATLLQVVRIVISMLFMIGRNRDYGPQAPTITPVRLIIVSVIGAILLVAGLVILASSIAH